MQDKQYQALTHHCERERIILWYDEGGTHHELYESFEYPGLQKLRISNNELALKHRVLKQEPEGKFLLYSDSARPPNAHNWLLDLALSQFVFASDKPALYLAALELNENFRPLIQEHLSFFENSKERLEPLRSVLEPAGETAASLRRKMLGVLTAPGAAERRLERSFPEILLDLACDSFTEDTPVWNAVQRHGLVQSFFKELAEYGYEAEQPSVRGAILAVFERVWEYQYSGRQTPADRKAQWLVDVWETSIPMADSYRQLLAEVERELALERRLGELELEELSRIRFAPLADKFLAERIAGRMSSGSYDTGELARIIHARRESYWVAHEGGKLPAVYELLGQVLSFESELAGLRWTYVDAGVLWQAYAERLFTLDYRYREVLRLYSEADSPGFLSELMRKLNDRYVHQFQQRLAEEWERLGSIPPAAVLPEVPRQREFFEKVVAPFLREDRKLVVVISDGLRYELGHALQSALLGLNRFEAECEPMLAELPSFTQLCMNSMLPHERVELTTDAKVLVDGKNMASMEQRGAHLERVVAARFPGKRAKALWAKDLYGLSKQAARDEVESIDLLFLYSNNIDATGDSAKTEDTLPTAAQREVEYLKDLCRKITSNMNRSHIVITADHGFLYQDTKLDDIYLLDAPPLSGKAKVDRRYIISEAELRAEHFSCISLAESGTGAPYVSFPQGLYRIRKQGGGSRYVHGGASLQELCLPLLRVQKTREDDRRQVDVQVLKGSQAITTGSYRVRFFQDKPVDAKTRPRRVRARFIAADGTLLSNTQELLFDSHDQADQNRGRECVFSFTPDANRYSGETVYLELCDIGESGHVTPYLRDGYSYRTRAELDF